MKARVFNITQYEKHPKTGETLLTKEQIESGLARKSVREWAYVMHDKDVYVAGDKMPEGKEVGDLKPRHWHVVGRCSYAVEISVIAKWFQIEEQYIDAPKGRGAFMDCVEYLTHESSRQQELGKYRYPDEDVTANFEWRKELDDRAVERLKYGGDLDKRDQLRYDVMYNGLTLREAVDKDKHLYMDDFDRLKKCRENYLNRQPPPSHRMNYYIEGRSGSGKGLLSRALARNLFPNLKYDEDIFFEVGDRGAKFEGYDGQPVIIWNDWRAEDLLKHLDGRGGVFNTFDTHPTKQRHNIKYSSVQLCNFVNIVNSVQPYKEFLDTLTGKKEEDGEIIYLEDKNQSYRRFPFIMVLHEKDFDYLINKGFIDKDTYTEYAWHSHIVGSARAIHERLNSNEKLVREMETKILEPVVQEHQKVVDKQTKSSLTEEEILKEFEDYGKVIQMPE